MSVISHFLRNNLTKCSCADIINPAQGIIFTHLADLEEQVPVIILVFPSFAAEETIIGASSVSLTAAVYLFITLWMKPSCCLFTFPDTCYLLLITLLLSVVTKTLRNLRGRELNITPTHCVKQLADGLI